jgi:hypothetical protein
VGTGLTTVDRSLRPSITVLAPGGIEHSGLSILASRWAQALRSIGCSCQLLLGVAKRHPDEGEAEEFKSMPETVQKWAKYAGPEERLLVVGLPPSDDEARATVSALAVAGSRALVLWEHPHTPVLELAVKLRVRPPAAARIGTLNPRFVAPLRKQLGTSAVFTLPLTLPPYDDLVGPSETSCTPYAVAVGRYTSRKGAARLCSMWADGIGEELGMELLMLGSGYDGPNSDKHEVLKLASSSRWISCESIGSFPERFARVRGARCAIFAATDDHLPQALVEVLAAQIPAVVTPIDPHMTLVRHGVTGIAMSGVDLTDLRSTLERHILSSPNRCAEITRAGAELVTERFSSQVAAETILSHLV